MRSRVAQWCFAAWMVVLVACYYAWPEAHLVTWSAIAISSAAAIVAGIWWHRPRRSLPWVLIAASVACFAAGDTIYYVQAQTADPPFPGPADVFYLVVYLFLAAGLLILVRTQTGEGRNRAALLDALVPTVGLGLLSWVYLIAPYTRADDMSVLQRIVSVGYPLGDMVALAIMLRLLAAPGRSPASLNLLAGGVTGLLASDVIYGLLRLDAGFFPGGPTELGWVVFYLALGAAGLHPSMTRVGEPGGPAAEEGRGSSGGRRLAAMTAAAMIAPAVLYLEYLQGDIDDAPVVAAAAALMFLLVLARVSGLIGEISRRDSQAYFRTLIQSASDVILIVDDDDTIRYASPSAAGMFGHADLTGAPLATLIADTHSDALADLLAQVRLGTGATLDGADLTAVCADRRLIQVECDARDLRADRTVRGVVLTMRDVTERRRLENDLAHQAFHDGLTGLANRVLFRNRLEHAYTLARRDGSAIGVLFVDLDDFKEVNDTLGHAVGDQLLVAAAKRIEQTIGPGNTAARMGGDEFAILVEQADDPGAPEDVAARIVAALAAPVDLSDGVGGMYVVSAASSVGVAGSRDATSATELLRHADMALYLAKGAGKATWQPYRGDLHTAMVERLEMRTALHEAVDAEQFVLQYQPIVELGDRRLAGVESLVRWQHPTRGLLGPQQFIELAEENGAITGIGAWVMRESLRQLVEWRAGPGEAPGYVSVNVSARQFRAAGFVGEVREALAATGARPEWLLLEITESLVLRDAEQVWADLRELRALGVRIAIDDFGTGYSSLSYLRQMPVDVLKIDKSFIDDVLGSRQQRALVNAIVTLARNLDLAVVAEGIEDGAQHALLTRMGCPYGQGYLFSRPVWPDVITGWVRSSPAAFPVA